MRVLVAVLVPLLSFRNPASPHAEPVERGESSGDSVHPRCRQEASGIRNPYFKQTEWRVWRLDEKPIDGVAGFVPPADKGPATLKPLDAAKRLWPGDPIPGKLLDLSPRPSKKYAGTWDDVYASWSGTHGWMRDAWKSPAGAEAKGLKDAVIHLVDQAPVDNHYKLGINFYHQSTTGMGHTITNAIRAPTTEAYEKIYFASGLICSPCHLSLVEEGPANAAVATDLYMAYMPTLFNSVGSSDSETMAITKMVIAGAHLSPAMKLKLKRSGLYASTMLWLWKSTLPVEGAFDSEWRHRTAYAAVGNRFTFPGGYGAAGIQRGDMCLEFHQYDDTEHMKRMIDACRALDAAPPEAVVDVVEHKGGTRHYALKKTVCVIQEAGQDVELRVSTAESYDLDNRPLALRWKLLYGNRRATVEREGTTAVWKIRVPWDDALPEGRTTLLLTAHNGVHDGNPAAINIYRRKGDLPPNGSGYEDYKFDTKHTNRRPIVVGLQDIAAKPGDALVLPLRAIDPEGFAVTYTKRAGEPGAFDGSVWTWKVPRNQPAGDLALTIIGSDGTSGNNYEAQQIRIQVLPKVFAKITADKVAGKAPLSVKFSVAGSIGGQKAEWAFAPRQPGPPAMPNAESTEAQFVKVFDKPGIYDAWLRVKTGSAEDVARTTIYVTEKDLASARPAKLAIEGNGAEIAAGDETPSTYDHTDFGPAKVKSPVEREFLLRNLGDTPLKLGKMTVAGDDFTLVQAPRDTVEGGGSTRAVIRFAPKGTGAKTATVEILGQKFTIGGAGAD